MYMPLVPKVSEKSFLLSEDDTYVFTVPISATKHTVRRAVESQFGVTVKGVRISVNKGKPKNSPQKRKAPVDGKRKDTKRAYVTIKEGENIPVFEESK
jgi:large subunit ribosomal protein L23